MIYAMSDIHGEYEKYLEMLKLINFSDDDTLYILGDVIDRGNGGIKLLLDMSGRFNVYPLLGNHEIMALKLLKTLMVEITDQNFDTQIDSDTMRGLLEWQQNGGTVTIKQFSELDKDTRFDLIDYLEEFEAYATVDTPSGCFVLVHSGLGNFKPQKKLSDYSLSELCFMRPDYDRQLFEDNSIFIVSGHTPTKLVSGKNEIFKSHNNINIDCGAVFGGRLACLRLDDMKEFYV